LLPPLLSWVASFFRFSWTKGWPEAAARWWEGEAAGVEVEVGVRITGVAGIFASKS
jgi:hypothetical protein